MSPEALIDLVFTSIVGGTLGVLLWTRLNRLEAGQQAIRTEIARIWERMATRDELVGLRTELVAGQQSLREELLGGQQSLREELGGGQKSIRDEIAAMRSDLTYVALAVGANRPRPMEGSGETSPDR